MKYLRNIILLLGLVMTISLLPTTAYADELPAETSDLITEAISGSDNGVSGSGSCGGNLTWSLDENGVLTIRGTGEMYNYWEADSFWEIDESIKKVVIENGVTSIGEGAFGGCGALASVIFPDSLKSIGNSAFYGCESLERVTIPEGVTKIDGFAFADCTNMSEVSLPSGLETVGGGAFTGTPWLEAKGEVAVENGILLAYEGKDSNVVLPDQVTLIAGKVFSNDFCPYYSRIKSVVIPAGVTGIGDDLFFGCSNLTSVTVYSKNAKFGTGIFDLHGKATQGSLGTGFTLYGYTNSTAENYAKKSQIHFKDIENSMMPAPALGKLENVNGGVKITWESVTGAEKYRVFRKSSGGSWTKVGDTASLNYTDKTAVGGTAYTYTVRCISSDGKTFTSRYDAAGKTITYIAAPVLSNAENVNGGVRISWAKSAGAEKYRVYRKTGSGSWAKLGDTTAVTYTDKTALSGTKYSYTVRCLNAGATAFTSSFDPAGKTITYIAAPVLSKAENVNGGVKITWGKVTGAAKYRLFRKTGSGSWSKVADTTGVSYTDITAKSGTKYTYTVRCISSDGKTFTSSFDSAGKTITYVAAPVISKLENVSNGVKITWGKVAGAGKYRVYRKTGSGSWTKLGDTTSVTYTDKTAKKGTKYTYTVRCLSSDGKVFLSSFNSGKSITH